MKKTPAEPSFAELSEELERIAARLEEESLPLEDAISTYEKGIVLVRKAQERLQEAEQKVEILSADPNDSAPGDSS